MVDSPPRVPDPSETAITVQLTELTAGTPLVWGGDRVTLVDDELAAAFTPGDALLVLQHDGTVLHVPAADRAVARGAVDVAVAAFAAMGAVDDPAVTAFYEAFARRLEDDATFAPIAAANEADVDAARARGRSTTRLLLDARMRRDMIAGLRVWRDTPGGRGRVLATHAHAGWSVDEVVDGLGVVAFVFEGRPNVFADACGVLRAGDTVVFRIGSDALGTARAIVEHALDPALEEAGLPPGAATLVDAPTHAAAWATFSDPRLALAVARGSGSAVAQLGAVARQAGVPVSLHGTGGAWLVADATADTERFGLAVEHSLDRKVCNTLNTLCVVRDRADELVPVAVAAAERAAAARGARAKLHVHASARAAVGEAAFTRSVPVARADGTHQEPQAEPIDDSDLATEWEWEDSPELTLVVVDDVAEAVALCNAHSPRFVASLISEDPAAHDAFFAAVDAPFVGDGFTRWVDGQYALDRPELGLSNWEHGRLFARSGILSGDVPHTVRMRATVTDRDLHR
jgi:glutamate-5-semialdehyde dehydrogenase